MNSGRTIICDGDSPFSQDYFKSEQARAIKTLVEADEFILISHAKKGGGDVISCVTSKNILPMSYATNKINKDIYDLCREMIKEGVIKRPEGKGKDE